MGITVTLPSTLTNGTTADASQVMADLQALVNAFLLAAANGANSDITSLSGLTTPLSVAQGGTGANTPMSWAIGGCMLTMSGTTVTITPGFAVDTVSGSAVLMTLATKITKTLTGAWAAGDGSAGGGTFTAGTLLDVWLIRNPSGALVDVFVAAELTFPNLPTFPTGYTQARRIGSLIAGYNSHMLGNITTLDIPGGLTNDTYGSTTDITTAAVNKLVTAPTLVDAWLLGGTIKSSAAPAGIKVYNGDTALLSCAQPSLTGSPGIDGYSPVTNQTTLFTTWINANTARGNPSVTLRANAASTTYSLWTQGWYDSRQGTA